MLNAAQNIYPISDIAPIMGNLFEETETNVSHKEQPIRKSTYVGMVSESGLQPPMGYIFAVEFNDEKTREVFIRETGSSLFPSAYFLKEGRKTFEKEEVKSLIINDIFKHPSIKLIENMERLAQKKQPTNGAQIIKLQR